MSSEVHDPVLTESEVAQDRHAERDRTGIVLRDMTERVHVEQALQELLAERSGVAVALQGSLAPRRLPEIPGSEPATRYESAGNGHEIGGDFLDVFARDDDTWGWPSVTSADRASKPPP